MLDYLMNWLTVLQNMVKLYVDRRDLGNVCMVAYASLTGGKSGGSPVVFVFPDGH
jgi:hypothetical protein